MITLLPVSPIPRRHGFSRPVSRLMLTLSALTTLAFGQAGDRGGEVQVAKVPAEIIPPAPALSAEEALKTFKLAPGFKIEIVASDPLIDNPVALQFGPDGRIWVLEMRGYMPNEKGEGESAPVGRISVLEDTNKDGRMDKSTPFLEGLVMPRAFMLMRGGLLVAEPPLLWYYRDTDGDGKADDKTLMADNYAVEANPLLGTRMNVEHSANSLTWMMDNWIYSANYATRFRNTAGVWEKGTTVSRGQWGISQDNYGRLFHNSNSDQLRTDLVPAEYLGRNPNFPSAQGANYRLGPNQVVWPSRMNPGVNRGYQDGQLRTSDWSLATFTGACGPVIYRGDLFPASFLGNAFLCEPTGNLVRRNVLTEKDGVITAENPYDAEHTEFLASTDERFRPVNLYNGPDGGLYVVDMYHGIIQHRVYVTTYLLQQILSRDLQKDTNRGRIYRIVPTSSNVAAAPKPNLDNATSAELVTALSHANGWWRDTAQRLLVERGDLSALPALRKLAASGPSPLGQIHALWTLDGLGQPDSAAIFAALKAKDAKVRSTAVRVSETLLKSKSAPQVLAAILPLAKDPEVEVQRQIAFTLGEASGDILGGLTSILLQNRDNALVRDAVLSSLNGRELEMLENLIADASWQTASQTSTETLGILARAVFLEGKSDRITRLLDVAAKQTGSSLWRQYAILDGISGQLAAAGGGVRGGGGGARGGGGAGGGGGARGGGRGAATVADAAGGPVAVDPTGRAGNPPAVAGAAGGGRAATAGGGARGNTGAGRGGRGGGAAAMTRRLTAEPAALALLRGQNLEEANAKIAAVDALLLWPGKPGGPAIEVVAPLTAEQEILFQTGRQVFATTCAACHQPDGKGRDGLAPALADSEWVTGSEDRLIRIVLHGVRGAISVNGKTFQGEMTPLGALDDTQLAAALTFARRSFGHTASPVAPEKVAAVRRETASRNAAWTEAELSALP
jgi:mono/diheme cytochrome c family protein/glucose/arabinose dehydrogenase